MRDTTEMDVKEITIFIRHEGATLKKKFDAPVSVKDALEWIDQNVIIRFENPNSVDISMLRKEWRR